MMASARRRVHRRQLRFIMVGALVMLNVAAPVAQVTHGVVVDQTGLPLPGVQIDVDRNGHVAATVTTHADGAFAIDDGREGDVLVATLAGFETARGPLPAAARIARH